MSYSLEEMSEQLLKGISRAVLPKTRMSIMRRLLHHEVGMPAAKLQEYQRRRALHVELLGIVRDAVDGLTFRGRMRRLLRRVWSW